MIMFLGPYVGSFEYEITVFWPYVLWLKEISNNIDKIYISTHFNRFFLYKDIKNVNLKPIYKHITRDEENQIDHRYKAMTSKDYDFIIKSHKEEIMKRENVKKSSIYNINLGYTKNISDNTIYKKIFKPIDVSDTPEHLRNLLIFIPFRNIKKSEKIYKYLKNEISEDFVVIGDLKTPLMENNIILQNVDYFENGFKHIIGAITYSKAVVCPISFWTLVCNIQQANVFSWGNHPGIYKDGGIYSFNNKKSMILPNIRLETAFKSLRNFMNML